MKLNLKGKTLLATLLLISVLPSIHKFAEAERSLYGKSGWGGELLIPLFPIIIYLFICEVKNENSYR